MDRQETTLNRSYRLPLPPHKIASRQAHRVLEWALRDWRIDGDAADNARIVLSELVTNALTHSLDVFRLALCLNGDQILLEVWDRADGLPRVGLPDGLAVNGRGMYLVDTLSKEWGVRPEEDGGKTVWAKVPR
jgi:anti-sigma regulatory factor (Ser/Thr protein kinase)